MAKAEIDYAMLARLLRSQHDVITREQAFACGVSGKAVKYHTRRGGPWQTMLRGVYLAGTGAPTADQRDMAALLFAGAPSMITGRAALRWHGLSAPPPGVIDVLVPATRQRESSGFVRIHRTARIPDLVGYSGKVQFTMATRAVADAVRGLEDLREVRAVVAGAVQHGWCTVPERQEELREGPVAGSALLGRVLGEVADGIRSSAEGDLRDLIRRGQLPMPVFNARLYAGRVLLAVADAWWPEAAVAGEVDSREWHLSPESWERTLRRHARMTAHGILVLHFTPKQLRTEPASVIATIRAALRARPASASPVHAEPASG